MIKQIFRNNTALFVCPECRREFTAPFEEAFAELYKNAVCPVCIKQIENSKRAKSSRDKKIQLLASLDQRMEDSGFHGVFCNMETPPVRHNAEFIWRNRNSNLVISGETGAGKTSSAAFVMRHLMKEKIIKCRYTLWSELHSEYVSAKTRENNCTEERFFAALNKLDYLIIDELAWRRGSAKLTPVAQELLFNIIDGAYCQSRKAKVWFLGNFYNSAWRKLIDSPEPILRRLKFKFTSVWFDEKEAPKEDAQ